MIPKEPKGTQRNPKMAETKKHDGRDKKTPRQRQKNMMAETKKHGDRDKSLMAKQSWGRQRQKNTQQRQKNTWQRQKNKRQRQKNTSTLALEARA